MFLELKAMESLEIMVIFSLKESFNLGQYKIDRGRWEKSLK